MAQSWGKRIMVGLLLLAQGVWLSGCSLTGTSAPGYKVDLQVWGVFDDSDAYNPIFSAWQKANPFMGKMEYKKFAVDTYKQDLLDALASGNGPDVFMIRNSWLPAFQDKIVSVPDGLIDQRAFQSTFVDVVAGDAIGSDGKLYALPLSVDSLALYYNRDLLNAAGITQPPVTWEEFQTDAARLTSIDAYGNVTLSGASLGGWDKTPARNGNINRATDVLLALAAQQGAIPTRNTKVDFNGNAMRQAMGYYLQFADPNARAYSWNPTLHYSLDAFAEGRLAMTVNYSWQYPLIKKKNAKLNIAVAPLPQFTSSVETKQTANFANYWMFVVAKNTPSRALTPNPANTTPTLATTDPVKYNAVRGLEAWEFLKFLTMPNTGTVTLTSGSTGATRDIPVTIDPAKVYLSQTQKPAARRDLIELQKTDPVLGPFANGNLSARSWWQRDPETVEAIINDGLASLVTGDMSLNDGLRSIDARLAGYQNPNAR